MGRGEADEAKVASLKEQLSNKLDVYEKILTKQPYLAGQVSVEFYRCSLSDVRARYSRWPICFICPTENGSSRLARVTSSTQDPM